MPREGVFVKVLREGAIKVGDDVQVLEPPKP
jgi:MOSC domain-containing protein YiiM